MKTKYIFTTGAFLYPMNVKDAAGNDRFVWVASAFEEDSYNKDGMVCNPTTEADTADGLLLPDDDEEEPQNIPANDDFSQVYFG